MGNYYLPKKGGIESQGQLLLLLLLERSLVCSSYHAMMVFCVTQLLVTTRPAACKMML